MKLKQRLLVLALVLLFMAVPVSVLAHGTEEEHASETHDLRPEIVDMRLEAKDRALEARKLAEERKSEIKQQVEQRRAEIKQDVCERRQEKINKIIPRLSNGATQVKSSMDKVYEKVVGFYESGQLTVDNYEELIEEIESAKANSEEAIDTIKDQVFVLDCENPNVGQQLDGFRLSVKDARDSLKEYRAALVELISSLRAEAAEQNAENEKESETENETEAPETENETEGTENE